MEKVKALPMEPMVPLAVYSQLSQGDTVAVLAHTPYGRICGGAVYEGYKNGCPVFLFPEGSRLAIHMDDIVYLVALIRAQRRV